MPTLHPPPSSLSFPVPLFIRIRFKPKTQRQRYPHLLRGETGSRGPPRLAGRLSARLASIHFCLSVNNMASCVCVVVLTATTAPPPAPSRPLTVAPLVAAASAAEPAACITLHLLISIHTRRGLNSQKGAASAHQGGEKGGRAPSPQCAVWVK